MSTVKYTLAIILVFVCSLSAQTKRDDNSLSQIRDNNVRLEAGKIFDPSTSTFVSPETLLSHLQNSRGVQHRLQRANELSQKNSLHNVHPEPGKVFDPTTQTFVSPEVLKERFRTRTLQQRSGTAQQTNNVIHQSLFSVPIKKNVTAIVPQLWGLTSGGGEGSGTLFSMDVGGTSVTHQINLPLVAPGKRPFADLISASNGKLYGMTSGGGANGNGVIFEYEPSTNVYTKKHDFDGTNGHQPLGSLMQASNGKLYGMTRFGGANNMGVLFEYDLSTSTFAKKYDFDNIHGNTPVASLIQSSNGKLYGTAAVGGANGKGVLFEYDITANTYTVKFDFDGTNGANPFSTLLDIGGGLLFGTTFSGGANDRGVIFLYEITTNTYTKRYDFVYADGANPNGSLIQASDGYLYGMTKLGGANGNGALFQYQVSSNTYIKKYDFVYADGATPFGSLVQASNGILYGLTYEGGATSNGVLFEYDRTTNTYTKKFDFDGPNGVQPYGSMMQASNGKLYGMTINGGDGYGVLFEYNPSTSTFMKKLSFNSSPEGGSPYGNLLRASNGNFYGLTYIGGANGVGVLFEYNPSTSAYTVKYDFNTASGGNPGGSLIQATNGNLYGLASSGGANDNGTLFEYNISTNNLTNKFDFNYDVSGAYPQGSLLQASNGKLYGLTKNGGANGPGVLFEYDLSTNTYTDKYDFDGTNGRYPYGALIQASNGKLYGMTSEGGANNYGVIFEYDTPTNTYTKIYNFDDVNGSYPYGSLLQTTNGNLYGLTTYGGANGVGVLFEYNTATNTYSDKYEFNTTNGAYPYGSLMQASNGKLYGMTWNGGTNDLGVSFEYDTTTFTLTKKLDFISTNGANPNAEFIEVTPTSPEMDVKGNNTSIVDGDATPSTTDSTNFGRLGIDSSRSVTFTIENSGDGDLYLTGTPKVSISGTNASDFSVTTQPSSPVLSNGGTTFVVTFTPSAVGTRTATISIDNNDADENPYNFSVQGTGVQYWTLTVNVTGNGSVTKLPDQVTYEDNSTVTLFATPGTGYHFLSWFDGTGYYNINPLPNYTMASNKTFTAIFEINTYTITPGSFPTGQVTIIPSSIQTVTYGGSKTFNITTTSYYHIDSVIVNGQRLPLPVAGDSLKSLTFPFENVTQNHTIFAWGSEDRYRLTTKATNGTVTRDLVLDAYAYLQEVTLVAKPNARYHFTGWSGDTAGTTRRNDTLTVTMGRASRTITANFAINTYTIRVTQSTGGRIRYTHSQIQVDSVKVNEGGSALFYVINNTSPTQPYYLKNVIVDGFRIAPYSKYYIIYTFNNVTANHTLTADFGVGSTAPPLSVSLSTPNGSEVWKTGSTYSVPWFSYGVDSVKLTFVSGNSSYLITRSTPSIYDSTKYFSWTIPPISTMFPGNTNTRIQGRVKIEKVSNGGIKDSSDADFIVETAIQPTNTGTTARLNDVSFYGQLGYAVGDSGTHLSSSNGGRTWSDVFSDFHYVGNPPHLPNLTGVHVSNINNVTFLVGNDDSNAYIWRSYGGDNSLWNLETTLVAKKLYGVSAIGDNAFFVGENGYILWMNGGYPYPRTFKQIVNADPTTLTAIYTYRSRVYNVYGDLITVSYAVGLNGAYKRIYAQEGTYTNSISSISTGFSVPLKDVFFVDTLKGWAVGHNGTILKTIDAGYTWTSVTSGTTNTLNAITLFVDGTGSITYGYIVGNGGYIAKYSPPTGKRKWAKSSTVDDEWSKQESGTDKDLTTISISEDGSFVTLGDSGTSLTTQTSNIFLTAPDGGGNYIAGQTLPVTWASEGVNNVKIEYSIDSGQTWLSVIDFISADAGSYDWSTPTSVSENVLVAITDVEDFTVSDASSSTFSLVADVALFRTLKADTLLSKKVVRLKFDKNKRLTSGNGNMKTVLEHVFLRLKPTKGATFLGKKQTDKILKKKLGWIAYGSATDFGKMFTSSHTGTSYPIDSLRLPPPKKSKKLVGALKPDRKTYNNPAWEQAIVLRMNLIASNMGITPPGFGDLVLDTSLVLNGLQLQGLTLNEIGDWMDSVMTWWDTLDYQNTDSFTELAGVTNVLRKINEAFYDSVSFNNSSIDSAAVIKGDSTLSTKKPKNPFAIYLEGIKTASESGGLLKYILGTASKSIVQSGFNDEENTTPIYYELSQNYPNPFNPITVIRYSLPVNGFVTMKVYNLLGQEVAMLLNNEKLDAGVQELHFDGSNLASGIYFYRIVAQAIGNQDDEIAGEKFVSVKKMVLMR